MVKPKKMVTMLSVFSSNCFFEAHVKEKTGNISILKLHPQIVSKMWMKFENYILYYCVCLAFIQTVVNILNIGGVINA